MYSSENIIWIKNVKRSDGNGWAYENETCGKSFLLNWPTSKRGSAGTPNVGDIIVLFQKPNFVNGIKNKKVHLTHLVTPINKDIVEDKNSPNHRWAREVQLIAKANPIEAIPNPGYFNFFIPNRGLTNPIINLGNNIGLTEAETQETIWRLFQNHFCAGLSNQIFNPTNPLGVYGETEGDKIVREHIRQELSRRNSRIVQLKKSIAFENNNGHILCEACNFDFVKFYGNHAVGFIECHHKIHISSGERITNLEDLSLVCSNCHRMLHRKNNSGEYFSVEELSDMINTAHNR